MRTSGKERFVIEGAFAIVALISLATLAIVKLTPVGPLLGIDNGQTGGQKTTQSYKETIEPVMMDGRPATVQMPDGSEGLIFKRTKSSLDERTQPKLPWWQRILQVGWWWVALTVAGMFFAPLGMVMSAVNSKAKKAALAIAEAAKKKHEEITGEAQTIVTSIDAGLDAIDTEIAAAESAVKTATDAAAATADAGVLAMHTAAATQHRRVAEALRRAKEEFLWAMEAKSDRSTRALMASLREMGHKGKVA